MELNGVEIEDTYAEAFDMQVARILITAATAKWANTCAQSAAGFATSVIECKIEAGIDQVIPKTETPDKRPGLTLLFAAMSSKELAKQLRKRTGQSILTCPTSAVFNYLDDATEWVDVGDQLRYFGDGFERRKRIGEKLLLWRIAVIGGEFVIEEKFGFNKTTARTFILDKLKGWLLALIIGGGLLALIVWFYKVTTDMFWIYAWIAISLFMIFMARTDRTYIYRNWDVLSIQLEDSD